MFGLRDWLRPKRLNGTVERDIRRQLARVRELDRQHREAFEYLLRLFDWEIQDREQGYYEFGRESAPYGQAPPSSGEDKPT